MMITIIICKDDTEEKKVVEDEDTKRYDTIITGNVRFARNETSNHAPYLKKNTFLISFLLMSHRLG